VIYIDVREYYLKDGKQCPTAKGVQLTRDQFDKLAEQFDEVKNAIEKLDQEIKRGK